MTSIGLWGSSTGGSAWSFQLPSDRKLKKITLDHEDWIYSLCFTTEDFRGHGPYGGTGGRSGGQISEVIFEADEEIIGISGTVGITTGYYSGYIVILSVSFVTNKKTHGPFGQATGTAFSASWDKGSFSGFHGRAGFYLDALGVYLKPTMNIE